MTLQRFKIDPFLIIITPALLFLLFWNLGNQFLWYDEAQTAVLSRSVLIYGYPRALIGDFLVATDETYGLGMAYIAQPWLQNYICALSFLLFGESNTSARILFALFGLFAFYLLYALSSRLFKNKFVAGLALIIAATSVPYLLHLRQCRYYSLTIFFTLASLLAYLKFLNRERMSSFLFVLSSFLLFHSNFGAFVPILAGLGIHFFFIEKNRTLLWQFSGLYLWVFFLTLPWAIIYKIWVQGAESPLDSILHNAKFYLSKINRFFLPYRFLAIVLVVIFAIKRRLRFTISLQDKKSLTFLSLLIIVNWIFLWFADYNSTRYIIHIAWTFFIIMAYLVARLFAWNRAIAIILILVFCFTDLLNISLFYSVMKPFAPLVSKINAWVYDNGIISEISKKRIAKEINKLKKRENVKAYFFDYIYEITHDYDGPIEGVVRHLVRNAKPGDTIKTNGFSSNHLFFYTDLNIDPDLSRETYPEWIFLRDYWTEDTFYDTEYFKKIAKRYVKIELDYPDIRWENRPDDMSYHYFKTPPLGKKISIYRRID